METPQESTSTTELNGVMLAVNRATVVALNAIVWLHGKDASFELVDVTEDVIYLRAFDPLFSGSKTEVYHIDRETGAWRRVDGSEGK